MNFYFKLNRNQQVYKETKLKFKKYQESLKKEQEFWFEIFDSFEFRFEEKYIRIGLRVRNIRKSQILKFFKDNFENFELSDYLRDNHYKYTCYLLTIFINLKIIWKNFTK